MLAPTVDARPEQTPNLPMRQPEGRDTMGTSSSQPTSAPGFWALRDAKARFSELVRKVQSQRPRHVPLHGREEVIVVSADGYRRLPGGRTGRHLIDALLASPKGDLDIAPERSAMPVRAISL